MTATLSNHHVVEALRIENDALRAQIAELESFRQLAYRDALTGLWNRRYFDERVEEQAARAERNPRDIFSVVVADMDGLKVINDVLGHAAGDESIVWCAAFIENTLRSHEVCCRIGGDEFAVILPGAEAAECNAVIERLRKALDSARGRHPHATNVSFGGATWSHDAGNVAELIAIADRKMYKDKSRNFLVAP